MRNKFLFFLCINQKAILFYFTILALCIAFQVFASQSYILQTYSGQNVALSSGSSLSISEIILTILVAIFGFGCGVLFNKTNRRSLAAQIGLSSFETFIFSNFLLLIPTLISAFVIYRSPSRDYLQSMIQPMAAIYVACFSYFCAMRYRLFSFGIGIATLNLICVIVALNFHFLSYQYSYSTQIMSASLLCMFLIFLILTRFDLIESVLRPTMFIGLFFLICIGESYSQSRTFGDMTRKISFSDTNFSREMAIESLLNVNFYEKISEKRHPYSFIIGMQLNDLVRWMSTIPKDTNLTAVFDKLNTNRSKLSDNYYNHFPFENVDSNRIDNIVTHSPQTTLECEAVLSQRPSTEGLASLLRSQICISNLFYNYHPRFEGKYETNLITAFEKVYQTLPRLIRQKLILRLNEYYQETALDKNALFITENDFLSSQFLKTVFAKWRKEVLRKDIDKLQPAVAAGRKHFADTFNHILQQFEYESWTYSVISVLNPPSPRSKIGVHPFRQLLKIFKKSEKKKIYDTDEVWLRLNALFAP